MRWMTWRSRVEPGVQGAPLLLQVGQLAFERLQPLLAGLVLLLLQRLALDLELHDRAA